MLVTGSTSFMVGRQERANSTAHGVKAVPTVKVWQTTLHQDSPYDHNYAVIDCGVPSTTNNTKTISYNGTYRGDVVHYTCETGYTLVGTSTRVCLSNRQWSGAPPLCQGTHLSYLCLLSNVLIDSATISVKLCWSADGNN